MRRTIWGIMVLVSCNVAVDGGTAGLSMGMSAGPGGTSATAIATDTDTDTDPDEGGPDTGASADETGATTEGTGPGDDESTGGLGSTTSEPPGSTGDALGDPLDPGLDVPEGGQPCTTPGSLAECPALEVCRFHTTEQGLCESCDACGNLGAPCVQGTDCDILFACYLGQCTNICELGTFYCGPVEDCLDVGHRTHGVCAPF